MLMEPKTKLKLVLAGIGLAVIFSALNPFLIVSGIGGFSKEFFQGLFSVLDFLFVVYLWSQFNGLRTIINKKELEDGNISRLEKKVNRIIRSN